MEHHTFSSMGTTIASKDSSFPAASLTYLSKNQRDSSNEPEMPLTQKIMNKNPIKIKTLSNY